MTSVAKKIETAANIAIIVGALTFVLVAVRRYIASPSQSPPRISVGTKFALQSMDWQNNKKNIVFALSTNCHFCTESAEFYRALAQQCKQDHVRTIAVFPQQVSAAEAYLNNLGVQFDEVRQVNFSDVQIGGTPTLLFLSDRGVVQNVWIGKLPGDIEKEVLAKARP